LPTPPTAGLLLPRGRLPHSAVKIKLVCQDSAAAPREFFVDRFPCELGRGLDVAIRLDDRWLSRRHCRLDLIDGEVLVSDLSSRHGTLVNGIPVDRRKLLPGDRLCIGSTHFVVEFAPSKSDSQVARDLPLSAAMV
jgi:pSer/pThr/pTyr-binding forkhead associated (FHA) protein